MEVLFLAALIALIPAFIAKNKGRSFVGWYIFGFLLWIVAFPLSLIVSKNEEGILKQGTVKKCPHCAELIKTEANVCRFCGKDV